MYYNLDYVISSNKSTCILCNKIYKPAKEIGTLNCCIHPDGISQRHYLCCGASNNENDISHFDYKKVQGCLRIDHVSSFEECQSVKKRPYAFLYEEDVKKNGISEFNIIERIPTEEKLHSYGILKIKVAYNTRQLEINLKNEYNEWHEYNLSQNKLNGMSIEQEELNLSLFGTIMTKRDGDNLFSNNQGGIFKPFCVVRRVSYKKDTTLLYGLNLENFRQCTIYH